MSHCHNGPSLKLRVCRKTRQPSYDLAMEIHGELVKLQAEGITKCIGLSAHSYFDKALALIATGGFGLRMLAYGYMPRGHNQVFSARGPGTSCPASTGIARKRCPPPDPHLDAMTGAFRLRGGVRVGYVWRETTSGIVIDAPKTQPCKHAFAFRRGFPADTILRENIAARAPYTLVFGETRKHVSYGANPALYRPAGVP